MYDPHTFLPSDLCDSELPKKEHDMPDNVAQAQVKVGNCDAIADCNSREEHAKICIENVAPLIKVLITSTSRVSLLCYQQITLELKL